MIINPYKHGSRGAKALREALRAKGVQCWTLQRPPNTTKSLIVNWGNSEFDYETQGRTIVNPPGETYFMSNKIKFFESCGQAPDVLEWTRNRETALGWGTKVFARTKVEASGGEGIIVYDPEAAGEGLPNAPLYTRYVPKTHEYRLHMARGLRGEGFQLMLVQRKVFVPTPERPAPLDWKVRNHANGFIFQSQPDLEKIPRPVILAAARVMTDHFPKLHFAALDVMYHDTRNRAYVIEGNTAPGLENATVGVYADYFQALDKEHRRPS